MIKLVRSGIYRLIETKRNIRILYLDNRAYAWVEPWARKEILVVSRHAHVTDCILSIGDFCLYDVADEPHLPGKQFLELEAGDDIWQGYLLPTGLPTTDKKRSRIIATHEVVTMNPKYSEANDSQVDESDDTKDDTKKGEFYEITHSI